MASATGGGGGGGAYKAAKLLTLLLGPLAMRRLVRALFSISIRFFSVQLRRVLLLEALAAAALGSTIRSDGYSMMSFADPCEKVSYQRHDNQRRCSNQSE